MDEPLDVRMRIELPPVPMSSGIARRFIATTCQASGIEEAVCETASLLVSELVTNAIVHARTEVVMQVRPDRDRLHIEVLDGDPHGQVEVRHPDATEAGGRGLYVINQLALEWGVRRSETGKTVWFDLAIHPNQSSAESCLRAPELNGTRGPD